MTPTRFVIVTVATLVLAGCGPTAPRPELPEALSPRLERLADGELELTLGSGWTAGPVRVHTGPAPDRIADGEPLLEGSGPVLRFADPAPGERRYYRVERDDGDAVIVAERRLPLEGHPNFRDLGGYTTRDGRSVAWGRAFRSGELADLTDRDLDYLKTLGLRLVCDFRSPEERENAPDRLPEPGPEVAQLAIHDAALNTDEISSKLLSGGFSADDAANLLIEGNRGFASLFIDRYVKMFERLLGEDGWPILVHCTAGKDRAGYASALILLALGVPEDTVMEDYLLTNLYSYEQTEQRVRGIQWISLFRTSPEESRPLFEARREYLETAFDTMRTDAGSLDAFLETRLGLTPERREALRKRLLAP